MNVSLKISKKAFWQYIAIYAMLLINQSNFYAYYIDGNDNVELILIGLLATLLFVKHRNKARYGYGICLFMLTAVIFERVIHGGIGISFWYEISLKILITCVAIFVDEQEFLNRFIKVVSILAFISIIFWGLQLVGINLAESLFGAHDTRNVLATYDYQGNRSASNYQCYGMYIYSYLAYYPNRNVGIFTEPGIYQCVINAAIFVLVFMGEFLDIDKSGKQRLFLLFSLTLIITQSTTGYLGYLAILFAVLIRRSVESSEASESFNWKGIVASFALIAVIVLAVDLAIRGADSLLNVAFLSKLFDNSNNLSLVAENSTGKYRMASLLMSIQAMLEHPLGLGYDGWVAYSSVDELIGVGGAGGWPLKMGAILGVVPLLVLLFWLFYPLKNLKKGWITNVLFVFLYFNTSLAQTSAVYPVLIMITIFLREFER